MERQSGYYKMNFNHDELNKFKVTAVIEQKTLPEAVDILIKNLPLTKTVNGKFILIHPEKNIDTSKKNADEGIKGVVLDAEGEPLIGATIRIKGAPKGTITDLDGGFSLDDVDENSTLVISFIGKKEQNVKLEWERL